MQILIWTFISMSKNCREVKAYEFALLNQVSEWPLCFWFCTSELGSDSYFQQDAKSNGYINVNKITLPAVLKHSEHVAVTCIVQNIAQLAVVWNPGRCSENMQCTNGLPIYTFLMNPISCSTNKTHQKNRKKK